MSLIVPRRTNPSDTARIVCQACKRANPSSAWFCNGCGQKLVYATTGPVTADLARTNATPAAPTPEPLSDEDVQDAMMKAMKAPDPFVSRQVDIVVKNWMATGKAKTKGEALFTLMKEFPMITKRNEPAVLTEITKRITATAERVDATVPAHERLARVFKEDPSLYAAYRDGSESAVAKAEARAADLRKNATVDDISAFFRANPDAYRKYRAQAFAGTEE